MSEKYFIMISMYNNKIVYYKYMFKEFFNQFFNKLIDVYIEYIMNNHKY